MQGWYGLESFCYICNHQPSNSHLTSAIEINHMTKRKFSFPVGLSAYQFVSLSLYVKVREISALIAYFSQNRLKNIDNKSYKTSIKIRDQLIP